MMSREEFQELVASAYQELYDLVRLRVHPLGDVLTLPDTLNHKEKAWALHHLLLDAIEELDPGAEAPAYSHEWCRYRLMRLRYVNGMDPPAVARKIAVSRRQYYREHDAAIEAIAELLRQRHVTSHPQTDASAEQPPEQPELEHLELLRLEASRAAQAGRYTFVKDVVPGVLRMLGEMLQQRRLVTQLGLPETLPSVAVGRNLLRQMIVGTLGYLCERTQQATIRLTGWVEGEEVVLSLAVEPASAVQSAPRIDLEERLSAWSDLASLSGARIEAASEQDPVAGFRLTLPVASRRTVLVVDDNEDVLTLCQHYLGMHGYGVVTAKTAPEALALAREVQPHVITLDLMMPEQDGWDVLQILLNQPSTRDIPVVVCSVLREKDLALSLGATAFLAKPITEQALLTVLEAIGAC